MSKCAFELKAQCRIEIVKELENRLISAAIKHAKIGNIHDNPELVGE